MSRKNLLILLPLLAALLVACSRSQAPRLIGSYPSTPPNVAPTIHPVTHVVEIELQVENAEVAAEQAIRSANFYRGFLESAHTWRQSEDAMMILELAVPISYYESLRTDLLRLGILISERQSDQMIAGYSNYPLATHSHITVHLRQGPSTLPTYKTLNGRVLQTLQNAFAFSVSVISFFANFLIWLIVVTSPFALIGSLIYWVT